MRPTLIPTNTVDSMFGAPESKQHELQMNKDKPGGQKLFEQVSVVQNLGLMGHFINAAFNVVLALMMLFSKLASNKYFAAAGLDTHHTEFMNGVSLDLQSILEIVTSWKESKITDIVGNISALIALESVQRLSAAFTIVRDYYLNGGLAAAREQLTDAETIAFLSILNLDVSKFDEALVELVESPRGAIIARLLLHPFTVKQND